MLNIVVPMAGRGSRFANEGFTLPKPLIDVMGRPMIERVIGNLRPVETHRFVFLCLADHLRDYDLERNLQEWAPGCVVVSVDQVTEGAACTVLLAREHIDNADGLVIANSDQWVDEGIQPFINAWIEGGYDGFIMTMKADDPKWSYVSYNDAGEVDGVVEKVVVSDEATVGIYGFARGCDFVSGADKMIADERKSNGEYYVAPVYDEFVARGMRIGTHNVGREFHGMHGLGIPSDLVRFVQHYSHLR
jgi:NDP-sugar pyrophosphorylase family protein